MKIVKSLLILGPSFRRRKNGNILPAIERYDGLFYRVARKYVRSKSVDVLVMKDDLILIDGSEPMSYLEPKGTNWSGTTIPKSVVDSAKRINEIFLKNKIRRRKYLEIFISMGKAYAAALPDITPNDIRIIFPASGGPGPKAQALKEWLRKNKQT